MTLPTQDYLAEIRGPYGPVTISEAILQKIWLRGDFAADKLRTGSGEPVKVLRPGAWNQHEGPDFLGADMMIGSQRLSGDVEIHFYSRDWFAHGHDANPNFDRVVLHVVLFEGAPDDPAARTNTGREIPSVCLLPSLRQDLDSYVTQEALMALSGRDNLDLIRPLMHLGTTERRARFRELARARWLQKVAFAKQRVEAQGWTSACHQVALEVLGYRRNRSPMVRVAEHHPLDAFRQADPDAIFAEESGWHLAGIRPNNHPRLRLRQYAAWAEQVPDWPERLATILAAVRVVRSPDTATARKENRLNDLRERIGEDVVGNAISGTRLDTLICDAFLPFAACRQENELFPLWFHWKGGDVPDALKAFLRASDILRQPAWPFSNGLHQATLQYFIESDASI